MSENRILVIDDSATIRRLCDGELSQAGYHVMLAPNAEDGVEMATQQIPDLIILDHQLPGTTGYEVCLQLLANPETASIPVVASSTLRKKAYAEYLECDNVVDMLPKPYTPDALIATVESAINTAAIVVQSQVEGSSVPEVISELGEADLAGEFGCFGLREIIDLLNNGSKSGMLEVETDSCRLFVFVSEGRIQAVTASGIDPAVIIQQMPETLSELAPVIKLTVACRRGSEVDGLVELLNNKVLDPRLLKKLLRLQASVLLRVGFTSTLKNFRFDQSQATPPLFKKLPLNSSLLSFLVEGALTCESSELPAVSEKTGFVRKAIRGQNLDRAGLSSKHMRLMSLVTEPASIVQLAQRLAWSEEETQRVIHGFELAELIESCQLVPQTKVYAVVADPQRSSQLASLINSDSELAGKVVTDALALRLLLRRGKPDVLVVESNSDSEQLATFLQESNSALAGVRLVCWSESEFAFETNTEFRSQTSLDWNASAEQIRNTLVTDQTPTAQGQTAPELAACHD